MKDHLMATVAAVAIAAGTIGAFTAPPALDRAPRDRAPVAAAQAPESSSGIIIATSGSATISTKGMAPGGEVWATWYSLPPGKAVVEAPSAAKWAYVQMALDGSAVVTGPPTPMCDYISAGGRRAAATDPTTDSGDVEACDYAIQPGSRTENRGPQPYVFAGLSVGGPWKEGMQDETELYGKVNGVAKTANVTSSQFAEVEKEILKAGAMTVVIRDITMPPGAQIVTTDRYPTLRMVESGQLTLGSLPATPDAGAAKVLAPFDTTEWAPANAEKQIVLSNSGKQPVQFVEWTVAPVAGVKP